MVSTHLKGTVCRALQHSGLLSLTTSLVEPRGRQRAHGCFQVLTYHRVADDGDAYVGATSVAGFERQMRCIREHFHPMSLTDLLAAAARHEIPSRAIAVTFDDGYADLFVHAFPIVQRYQIPATVFLATGLMGRDEPMWNDQIGMAIRATTCGEVQPLPDLGPLPLRTAEQRQSALKQTLEALKRWPPAERACRTAEVVRALGVSTDGGPRMLRWEQVTRMYAAGIDVGAHTVNHPVLSCLTPEAAWEEIVGSKRMIEDRLQAPARHFAYPNGTAQDFDETTQQMVERAGFASAVSTIFGVNSPETDRYALRRGGPWEEDAAVFGAKLWWYRWKGARGSRRGSDLGGIS
jgi:peptidoglycan/xylan/chitin deacetylase (PgdA/CDA1 family)